MIPSRLSHRLLLIAGLFLWLAPEWVFGAPAMAATANAAGPELETGTLGNADFRIEIPALWNGDLIMLAHGYELPGAPRTASWPQDDAMPALLAAGYAVALSGYSSQGWAVREAIHDVDLLRQYFIEHHGRPRRSFLVGWSMGAAVAVASLEQQPAQYDGALSLCGSTLPGSQMFAELLTTLVAFDYFYPTAKGLPPQGLSAPAAEPMTLQDLQHHLDTILPAHPQAVTILAERLETQPQALASVIATDYLLYQEMMRRTDGIPVDNRQTVYAGFGDDTAFNAGAHRYQGATWAMEYAAESPQLGGRLSRPLVMQYNLDDPALPPRLQSAYPALSTRSGATLAPVVLPPTGHGHCDFSPQQTANAMKVLDRWATTGKRPVYR